MKYIRLFFLSIFIYEKKELKKKYDLIVYFIKNIDLIEYIKFIFDRNSFNPIKIDEFREYIKSVKKKNLFYLDKTEKKYSNKKIFVETFINHPAYTLSNIIVAKYLQKLKGGQIVGIIRKNDVKSEVLFRAYGVENIIYFDGPNFILRIYYLIKASIINYKLADFKKSTNFKYNKIDVGLTSYDTYIRYLRKPTINEIDTNFIIFFSQSLYATDFFQKKLFFKEKRKTYLIQSETQFYPLNILFQVCLKNGSEAFSRSGLEEFTVRHYNNWRQRYSYRGSFSQKLFNLIFSKFKKKSLLFFKKLYQKKIDNKLFGVDEVIVGVSKSKKIFISKSDYMKKEKLNSKPIVIFFLSHLLDGNFNYGYRENFKDIYSSTKFLIDIISKDDQINWIIKKHPIHDFFKAKFDFSNRIKKLINQKKNIKVFDERYDASSLLNIADLAFTVSGTVGVEYPSFGINTIFFEKSYYSNLNFLNIQKPKNITTKFIQKNIKQKLPKDYIEKCRSYLFIKDILAKSRSRLIPSYIVSRYLNEKNFWRNSKKLLENYDQRNDNFYRMFKSQLKFKMRHTINTDLIKNKNFMLLDYDD